MFELHLSSNAKAYFLYNVSQYFYLENDGLYNLSYENKDEGNCACKILNGEY